MKFVPVLGSGRQSALDLSVRANFPPEVTFGCDRQIPNGLDTLAAFKQLLGVIHPSGRR